MHNGKSCAIAYAYIPPTCLQVGCGAGNTLFPLLDANPDAFAYACDFSPSAVRLVRAHAAYSHGRAHAFVADITQPGALAGNVPNGAADVCTLVFVLSAISPEKMPQVCVGKLALCKSFLIFQLLDVVLHGLDV